MPSAVRGGTSKLRMCVMPACRGHRCDLVHKFPMNNARAERWRQIINDPELALESLDNIRKKRFICSRHFRPQDYKNIESRSLNITAEPSLMLDRVASNDEAAEAVGIASSTAAANEMLIDVVEQQLGNENSNSGAIHTADSMMRLEINFENVQVVHASNLNVVDMLSDTTSIGRTTKATTATYLDKMALDEELLDGDIVSILEPSPDRANTYRLSTISTKHQPPRQQQQLMTYDNPLEQHMKFQLGYGDGGGRIRETDDEPATTAVFVEDNVVEVDDNESSEMLLIPLSTESYMHLQNRLLQQQSQAQTHPEIAANEIVLDDILMEISKQDARLNDDGNVDSDADMVTTVTVDSDVTTLAHPTWSHPIQICHIWLRDHCRCALCYNADTNQRKQNLLDIPFDIRPQRVAALDGELRITWPDQHESSFDVNTLRQHFATDVTPVRATERTFWTAAGIVAEPYARVALNDLLCDDAAARSIVASLVRYGVAFVEKVPANLNSTETAVRRMFDVHKTLFGEMWSITDHAEHADTAYSKGDLGAHTDNTYFNDAAGLQVLHCVQHGGDGGDSLLVDGFRAVLALKERQPETYERLCTRNVPAEYVEEGQHHVYDAPIVRRSPNGRDLEQLRFNLYDRSLMTAMPPAEMRQFYEDLRLLTVEIQSPANEWWFKLRPGTVMIFDNWRVLHGRSAYSGRRHMTGCYVSRTEFQSVARKMGLIE